MLHPPFICVVEDDFEIREAMREVLELEGFSVKTASNGQEALDSLLKPSLGLPSLILLDLMMPVMNGWEFLEAVRRAPSLRDIPIVILSAVGDPGRLREAQVQGIMRKPVNVDKLLNTVGRFAKPASGGGKESA